ncbi:putative fatty acyl-CoA reductase CG5065 isoform X2 [Halictus rubicundus]|uniref:putative fatty acyl-CoA reductase CG5065 isoform X2 n=1 Tax=Halictus rubicundus TaxID=77578 RepID=UPI004036D2F6
MSINLMRTVPKATTLFSEMSSLGQLSPIMSATAVQTSQEQRNDERCIQGSSIEAFYSDAVILVTGATGFLGKALVEKLLRSCSRLITIFILVRPKKGHTIDQRLKQLLQNSVFDRLRAENPSVFNKIHPMKGDVAMPDLGLSPADKETLIQNVNIVFHSAATVRFDEPLKMAVNLNTKGTDRMIELCKSMKNLVSFIHVSTAYSNANLKEVNEAIYTTKVKPSTVIDMCESLDDSTLDILEKKILENHPNTYTFTKNLAEQLLLTKASKLPVAIIRPSIIGAARKEPYPGWVDNTSGITGIMKEVSRGALQAARCFSEKTLDLVPIDYVADTLICAAWHSTMQQNNSIKIYNCTAKNPLGWGKYFELTVKHARQKPSKSLVWYPGLKLIRNRFPFEVFKYTFHYLPALVWDFFYSIRGQKPTMLKQVRRMSKTIRNGQYFTLHEWKFHRGNMDDLATKVKALKDSDNFNTDMGNHDWDDFICDYVLGIRKFIMHDNSETKNNNFRYRLSVLYFIHRFTQVSSVIILLAMILRFGH